MKNVTVSIELTDAQMEALDLISRSENLCIEETIEWMTHQHIPALLDVVDVEDEKRKEVLFKKLSDETE